MCKVASLPLISSRRSSLFWLFCLSSLPLATSWGALLFSFLCFHWDPPLCEAQVLLLHLQCNSLVLRHWLFLEPAENSAPWLLRFWGRKGWAILLVSTHPPGPGVWKGVVIASGIIISQWLQSSAQGSCSLCGTQGFSWPWRASLELTLWRDLSITEI